MDYNPFLPEVKANPYPYYAELRRDAPVYQVPGVGFWVVSHYDAVLYAANHPQLFSASVMNSATTGDLQLLVRYVPPSIDTLREDMDFIKTLSVWVPLAAGPPALPTRAVADEVGFDTFWIVTTNSSLHQTSAAR